MASFRRDLKSLIPSFSFILKVRLRGKNILILTANVSDPVLGSTKT